MGKLSFRFDIDMQELQNVALPVEIRKPNLVVVEQALTTETVPLPPGSYYVAVQLPTGQELSAWVTLATGESEAVALLSPDKQQVAPSTALVPRQTSAVGFPRDTRATGSRTGHGVAKLRAFSGDALSGRYVVRRDQGWLKAADSVKQQLDVHDDDVKLVQLLQPGEAPVNLAMPAAPGHGCHLLVRWQADGLVAVDVQLESAAAATLLQYYERKMLRHAAIVAAADLGSDDPAADPPDPIAATIAAYVLLRVDDLERLQDHTEHLMRRFAWLPDLVAIRAEHLARLGEHEAALRTLLQLGARGLPFFNDGLSYAINRLRLYSTEGSVEQAFAMHQREMKALLDQLQRVATFADFGKRILTFSGLDPSAPDDQPVRQEYRQIRGVTLSKDLRPLRASYHPAVLALLGVLLIAALVGVIVLILSSGSIGIEARILASSLAVPFILTIIYARLSPGVHLTSVLMGTDGRISASKLQFLLWTLASLVSYAAVYITRASRGYYDPVPDIPSSLLIAMGMSATTAAIAKCIAVSHLAAKRSGKQPRAPAASAADLFEDDAGALDLGKVQMLTWTLFAICIYLTRLIIQVDAFLLLPDGRVAAHLVGLPDIDPGLLVLTGLGQFVFLGKKLGTSTISSHRLRLTVPEPWVCEPGTAITLKGIGLGAGQPATDLKVRLELQRHGTTLDVAVSAQTSSGVIFELPAKLPGGNEWSKGQKILVSLVGGRSRSNALPLTVTT